MNAYILRGITPFRLCSIVLFLDVLGLVAGIAMALSWPSTVMLGSQETSLALLLCFLAVGAVSSASNVTKYMLVGSQSGAHTSHLSTGMALGSLAAGLGGIARGFSSDLGFTVTAYLLLLCVVFLPPIVHMAILRNRMLAAGISYTDAVGDRIGSEGSALLLLNEEGENMVHNIDPVRSSTNGMCCLHDSDVWFFSSVSPVRNLLLTQGLVAALGFGLVPALISTVCSKFSSPYTILFLATGISTTIDPIGRYLTSSKSLKTSREVYLIAALLVLLSAVMLLLGCLPRNPLYSASVGGLAPAIVYIVFIPLFGFFNTSMFIIFKSDSDAIVKSSPGRDGANLTRLCGVVSQTGAMIGSAISFALIYLVM